MSAEVAIAIEKLKTLSAEQQREVLDFIEFLEAKTQRQLGNVPEQERWLWQNSTAIAAVQRGIEQVRAGDRHSLGSFAQYADLEIED